ncbi:deoxycytidylate deaminase [Mycobacterium phage SchoolBus]|nr:deoxycytidylate deaminase [Mycobacterium phage Familton]AVI04140.1 deoxycytidylate deaminase [Mycobacterium phage JangDynasty]AVP42767.1 deoxycytidylate deaminase [Mycobacterium phage SchoolBus]QGJ87431.1 deoxycytidylate deaminase [Mycobacterium phage Blessica]URM87886.1 hypothetical protein SEA_IDERGOLLASPER_115 [Mycobacterium phage Idergollasper]
MSGDWADDPGFKEYAKRCREELLPMMEGSRIAVALAPPAGKTDVKFAVELGFMIMLDKPIIAVVAPGTKVPPKLAKVADEIVEGQLGDPSLGRRVAEAAQRLAEKRGLRW